MKKSLILLALSASAFNTSFAYNVVHVVPGKNITLTPMTISNMTDIDEIVNVGNLSSA